ncbi:P-loop containing nucleoside triphosphate hydrolase protein [Trichoderma asperelloides]|nr:P-loop containing nucleoside triphosphate hydrolase protein [Trichoderma asperelloides]
MSQSTATERTPVPKAHYWKSSALLLDMNIFGGKGLGFETPFDITIHVHNETQKSSWFGFTIEVPFGPNLEEDGFGMCHTGRSHVVPAKTHLIRVVFPSSAYSLVEELTLSLLAAMPISDKKFCRLNVYLEPGTYSTVDRFGIPFADPGTKVEAIINHNEPMCAGKTLVDVLQQREFSFVVAAPSNAVHTNWCQDLPPPFRYPYGEEHFWSYKRYDDIISKNKGIQFAPAWSFDNDNEHLAALTQSQVQDFMWIHKASEEIGNIFFRAYFISPDDGDPQDCKELYAILSLGMQFLDLYRQPWSRLITSGSLTLRLFNNEDDMFPAEWNARIAENFSMAKHPAYIDDLVLQVQRPSRTEIDRRPDFEVKAFENRRSADIAQRQDRDSWTCVSLQFNNDLFRDYKRKIEAVNWFGTQTKPYNVLEKMTEDGRMALPPISGELQLKMDLHRALVRGNGFYKVLVPKKNDEEANQLTEAMAKAQLEEDDEPQAEMPPCSLPVVNLIDLPQRHVNALVEEILPNDRVRLTKYLTKRYLGLVLVAAPPGFGKTTVLAVIALSMAATLGNIFAAAPTNVATDNFAKRLDLISQSVTKRRNEGKPSGDKTRARRTFVMRGYKPEDEYDAFINTLQDPRIGDKAAPRTWISDSNWRLHLSPSFWLLMALRSKAVRDLHEDDHPDIHAVQYRLDQSEVCVWQEYENGPMVHKDAIKNMFHTLLQSVDILCTTPALSCQGDFKIWKEKAKGIAVDEAGNVSRPDLYCVWGNTLLPCALGGDDRQFCPANMTREDEKDSDGNHLNRLGGDARISALEFFRASGWPTFRLRVQLRMARGLFDLCHREVYSDLPFSYSSSSDLVNHGVGQALERYLLTRFRQLRPSPAGSLREVFMHCQETTCLVDEVTKSKRNPDQVENALEFLGDLVMRSAGRVRASSISIISPYKANVELIERRRKDPRHLVLLDMPPAATIDSFQGREADIIVVIMGTTQTVGPGFTTDKRRLNVMFSRQRSGLLIFGDINVLGSRLAENARSRSRRDIASQGREGSGLVGEI